MRARSIAPLFHGGLMTVNDVMHATDMLYYVCVKRYNYRHVTSTLLQNA